MASIQSVTSNESATNSAINGVESREETLQAIKEECELTWEHIQDTHHRLASHKETKPPVGVGKSNATLKIYQHKEKKLQAEINILKNQDVEVISKDLKFVETLVKDQLKKNIAQLQETLVIVKGQRFEVAGEIARERKLLEEENAIQKSLEEKLQACQQQELEERSQNSILAELQTKKKEAVKYHASVMNQLGKFLSKHFPAPGEESEEEDSRPQQYCSLQHIVETLMNRLFESPHDCYVEILPTYWPPYIQLLLCSNVVQRHPDNCDLIRLVAFHT